jgi:hypothetical protein
MFPEFSLPASVQALVLTIAFLMPGFIAGKVFSLCFRRASPPERVQITEYVTLSCVHSSVLARGPWIFACRCGRERVVCVDCVTVWRNRSALHYHGMGLVF